MFFNKDNLKALALLTQIAITMAVPIVLGVFIGSYLDQHFHTSPLLMIILIFLGVAAGFRNVYQITRSFTLKKSKLSDLSKYTKDVQETTKVQDLQENQVAKEFQDSQDSQIGKKNHAVKQNEL